MRWRWAFRFWIWDMTWSEDERQFSGTAVTLILTLNMPLSARGEQNFPREISWFSSAAGHDGPYGWTPASPGLVYHNSFQNYFCREWFIWIYLLIQFNNNEFYYVVYDNRVKIVVSCKSSQTDWGPRANSLKQEDRLKFWQVYIQTGFFLVSKFP